MGSGSSSGSSLSVTLRTACSTHHTQGHWKAPKRVRYTYLQLAVCSCRPRVGPMQATELGRAGQGCTAQQADTETRAAAAVTVPSWGPSLPHP